MTVMSSLAEINARDPIHAIARIRGWWIASCIWLVRVSRGLKDLFEKSGRAMSVLQVRNRKCATVTLLFGHKPKQRFTYTMW